MTRREPDTVYYVYQQAPNQVALVHYSGSGESWFIEVTPADGTVAAVFTPQVQEVISRASGIGSITITDEAGHRVGFTADLRDGRVSRLQWYPADR